MLDARQKSQIKSIIEGAGTKDDTTAQSTPHAVCYIYFGPDLLL